MTANAKPFVFSYDNTSNSYGYSIDGEFQSFSSGEDTSDATAYPQHILSSYTAYARGEKITGEIVTRSASNITLTNTSTTYNAGYYPNSWTVTGAGTNISDTTATAARVLSGYYFYTSTGVKTQGTIASKSAQTYTPGTSNQTISSGQYLSGAQTIQGDSNLVAANIKKGVSIFGKTGTFTGSFYGALIFAAVGKLGSTSLATELCIFEIDSDYTIRCKSVNSSGVTVTLNGKTLYGGKTVMGVYSNNPATWYFNGISTLNLALPSGCKCYGIAATRNSSTGNITYSTSYTELSALPAASGACFTGVYVFFKQ